MQKVITLWKRCWRYSSFKILCLGIVFVLAKQLSLSMAVDSPLPVSAPEKSVAVSGAQGGDRYENADREIAEFSSSDDVANTARGNDASYNVSDSAYEWTSPAGIYYGKDPSQKFDTRIDHVMAHTMPDHSKPKHSIFVTKEQPALLALLDKAWGNRGPPERQGGSRGRDVYTVSMGGIVGEEGQRKIRLVMEADSSDIVTAYPVFQ